MFMRAAALYFLFTWLSKFITLQAFVTFPSKTYGCYSFKTVNVSLSKLCLNVYIFIICLLDMLYLIGFVLDFVYGYKLNHVKVFQACPV